MYYINVDIDTEERYEISKFLKSTENIYDVLDSYFVSRLLKLPIHGFYNVQGEEKKPELLAYRIYGSVQYWWLLMLYNGILDNEELVSGNNIKYPSLDDIENIYFELMSKSLEG